MNIAVIGLDTSHSVELPKRMQAPDCPPELHVDGMHVMSCMRFSTPFQSEEGLDARQAQLEQWGIKVTMDFDEAVEGCDAIMMEINDPAYHLEYFRKVAALGKPVFLDKPLAGSLEDGRAIMELAKQHGTRVWSGSSVPFTLTLKDALDEMGGTPIKFGGAFGALGTAPAGDSLIWYGVHTFELLQRIMGMGARQVMAWDNGVSVTAGVDYDNGRRGLVELIRGNWFYGGRMIGEDRMSQFKVDNRTFYTCLLNAMRTFFEGGPAPISMEQTFEGLAMMCAANESLKTGRPAAVATL